MKEYEYRDLPSFYQRYGWLLLVTLLVTAFNSCYAYFEISFSPLAEFISVATLPIAVMIWIVWDAQTRRCTPCYDFGLMVYLGWPLVIPGYLFWTRGWHGGRLLLGLVGLVLLPMVVPIALFLVLY